MKRVIIVHGWDGTPEQGWYPWLKSELERRDFEVIVPFLPDTEHPHVHTWVPALASVVDIPDADTYFVGHSMGCQAIAHYLDGLTSTVEIGGVVYVAGYFKSLVLDENEEVEIWDEWHNTPLDLSRVRTHSPKSIAIFSDNDEYVPADNQDDFRNKLGSEIIVEHGKGHFTEDGGCFELPVALESVLKLVQS